MNQKILNALGQFNTDDDRYWTDDGLPVLEAVQHFAEDNTITRDMVTAAAPGFSRANPTLEPTIVEAQAGAGNDPAEPGTNTAPDQQTDQQPDPSVVIEDDSGSGDPVPPAPIPEDTDVSVLEEAFEDGDILQGDELETLMNDVQKRLAGVRAKISEQALIRSKLVQQLNKLYHEESTLDEKLKRLQPKNMNAHAIQSYLATQRRNLQARGAQVQLIKDSGIDLGQLAKDLKSPIDSAMARKRGRGGQRPNMTPIRK